MGVLAKKLITTSDRLELPPPFSGLVILAQSMTDIEGRQSQAKVELVSEGGKVIKLIASAVSRLDIE